MTDTPIPASAGQVREDADALREACKPWSFHTGEPPDDDSPLSGVFGAGITYAEHHLAELLGVKDFEKGDGSEDFRTDAGNTLLNILAAAGLYDRDECQFAALASPQDRAVREALDQIDVHQEADDYEFRSDGDYTPTDFEKTFLEDFGAGLMVKVYAALSTLSNQTGGDAGEPTAITEARLHAAMDAYFPGEDWRNDLGPALDTSLRDMRSALQAAALSRPVDEKSVAPMDGEGPITESANLRKSAETAIRRLNQIKPDDGWTYVLTADDEFRIQPPPGFVGEPYSASAAPKANGVGTGGEGWEPLTLATPDDKALLGAWVGSVLGWPHRWVMEVGQPSRLGGMTHRFVLPTLPPCPSVPTPAHGKDDKPAAPLPSGNGTGEVE